MYQHKTTYASLVITVVFCLACMREMPDGQQELVTCTYITSCNDCISMPYLIYSLGACNIDLR